MRAIFAVCVIALSQAGCVVPLPIIGGGIAGAGADPIWIRQEAEQYPVFQAENVRLSKVNRPLAVRTVKGRDRYFSNFEDHVHVADSVQTRLGPYQLNFIATDEEAKGIQITIERDGQAIVAERIPRAFYMGELQAGLIEIGGATYWLLAANSRSATNSVWLGIYRVDGVKIFAASLPQSIIHIGKLAGGIEILSTNGVGVHVEPT